MLDVRDLSVAIGPNEIVHIDALHIAAGERLGLVGESGSGKTMSAMSMIGLQPSDARVTGSVSLDGQSLLDLGERQLAGVRGRDVGVIFQDPLRSLNPLMPIGKQIAEPLRLHKGMNRKKALERAHELMGEVRLPDIADMARRYPHQLSGGQRQRVLIAMAIACGPKLLIADEPTTALDVTVQQEILDLLLGISAKRNMALLFVSHNLGVIRAVSDRIAVVYGGHMMETGPAEAVVHDQRHRYTNALIGANPGAARIADLPALQGVALTTIEGAVPSAGRFPTGCAFRDRCPAAEAACEKPVAMSHAGPAHLYRCVNPVHHARRAS